VRLLQIPKQPFGSCLFNSLAHFLDLGVDEVRAGDHVRQAVATEILRNDMLDRDWAITIMDYTTTTTTCTNTNTNSACGSGVRLPAAGPRLLGERTAP